MQAKARSKFSMDERHRNRSPSVDSEDLFKNLHRARGPIAKAELLRNRFSKLSAREGQYIVKILTGDLRIGLREGLVEEAITKAFGVSLEQVREANMLLGDIGQTALLASRNELARAELSLFRPIKCMLATPEPTAEAVWERFAEAASDWPGNGRLLTPTTVYLEDKFDGIRAQLHRSANGSRSSLAICGVSPSNSQSWPMQAGNFRRN